MAQQLVQGLMYLFDTCIRKCTLMCMKKTVISKITGWGNSFGLRLSKNFVRTSNISLEKPLEVSLGTGGSIVVREVKKTSVNLSKDYFIKAFKNGKTVNAEEYDWGTPEGKEIW